MPILTFIGMTLVMVWLAAEPYFFLPMNASFSWFVGASLLLGNIGWLVRHYRRRLRGDSAIASTCYFAGHVMIVRALYICTSSDLS